VVQPATYVKEPVLFRKGGTDPQKRASTEGIRHASRSREHTNEHVPSAPGHWRVVIADDQPLARGRLKKVLGQHPDLEVVGEANDGQGAVELCRRIGPDAALVDVLMPEMDGIEATRLIKREFPATSVVVMCTLGDPDHLLEALKAGAAGYVLKRSGPQQIRDAVWGALIGECPLDEETTMELLRRLVDESPNGCGH
jgi:DNA-binding NarL/FixJ family response regulator